MKVLGIETATRVCSVAVIEDEVLLAERTTNLAQTHSLKLMPSIEGILREVNLEISEIDGIAVSIGPGSFTGLRIGLSAAKGLALGMGRPVVGVPTLEAMAWLVPYAPYPVCPLLDARRKEVYGAIFRYEDDELKRILSEVVLPVDELLENIFKKTLFLGNGTVLYRDNIFKKLGDKAIFAPGFLNYPRASQIAFLGGRRLKQGDKYELSSLEPFYIRPPDALSKRRRERE